MLASGQLEQERGRQPERHYRYLVVFDTGLISARLGSIDECNAWISKRGYSRSSYRYVDTWSEPGRIVDELPDSYSPQWYWEAS